MAYDPEDHVAIGGRGRQNLKTAWGSDGVGREIDSSMHMGRKQRMSTTGPLFLTDRKRIGS
jgi:hypothetical protein